MYERVGEWMHESVLVMPSKDFGDCRKAATSALTDGLPLQLIFPWLKEGLLVLSQSRLQEGKQGKRSKEISNEGLVKNKKKRCRQIVVPFVDSKMHLFLKPHLSEGNNAIY